MHDVRSDTQNSRMRKLRVYERSVSVQAGDIRAWIEFETQGE